MRLVLKVLIGVFVCQVAVAVFERLAPHSLIRWYWKIANPPWRLVAGRAPGFAIVETTGRRTGRKHQVPVGARLQDRSVWLVAAHAGDAHYVKNIKANPEVRVQIAGRWCNGLAHLVPEDDARQRAVWLNPLNGLFERVASSDLMSVRIDLEESSDSASVG